MKKSTIFLLIIDILLILFGIFMYKQIMSISKTQIDGTLNTADGIFEMRTKISELEERVESLEVSKEKEKDITSEVKFDANKIKSDYTNVQYKESIGFNPNSAGLKINIKAGKAYLSTDIEDEQYKFLFPDIKKAINDQEITEFKTDVKDVYYAYIGNGDMQPIILFLMEDGTVEYIDSGKMLKDKKYVSSGKINELNNIVKFVNLALHDLDENGETLGGIMTVGAIDADGYTYDLSACDAIKNIKK